MYPHGEIVLVLGATGHQGGAATRHLLDDGWHVRALTRDPNQHSARALSEQGAEVVVGDLLDPDSLRHAVRGAHGVFSVETPFEAGYEGEEIEGINIADISAEEGVRHFVYSSVAGAESDTGPGWVVSKHHIEQHIQQLGLPATVWRPVTFMENFLRQKDEILSGKLAGSLWPESIVYRIAVDDIGRFVALAFREPERFVGTTMAIAAEAMTMEQTAETFAQVLGTPVAYEHVESAQSPAPPRPQPGEQPQIRADIEACRALIPDLVTLAEWVEATGWKALVRQ